MCQAQLLPGDCFRGVLEAGGVLEEVVPYATQLALGLGQAEFLCSLPEVPVSEEGVHEVEAVGLNGFSLAGEVRVEVCLHVEVDRPVLPLEPVFGTNVVDMWNGILFVSEDGIEPPVDVAWNEDLVEPGGRLPVQHEGSVYLKDEIRGMKERCSGL